jgi:hypothetical protein
MKFAASGNRNELSNRLIIKYETGNMKVQDLTSFTTIELNDMMFGE